MNFDLSDPSSFILTIDILGTIVFAISGALAAGHKRMDIFGVVVLACTTAIGGGTLRDLVLGLTPVGWVSNPLALYLAGGTGLITWALDRWYHLPDKLLFYVDAAGLAIFTVTGFEKGMQVTNDPAIAAVMGVMTGVFGGIIRDVLAGEVPLILRQEIYASASLIGAILYGFMRQHEGLYPFAVYTAVGAILAVRLIALNWHLSLPVFTPRERATKPLDGDTSISKEIDKTKQDQTEDKDSQDKNS